MPGVWREWEELTEGRELGRSRLQPAQHIAVRTSETIPEKMHANHRRHGKSLLEILLKFFSYFNKTRHLAKPLPSFSFQSCQFCLSSGLLTVVSNTVLSPVQNPSLQSLFPLLHGLRSLPLPYSLHLFIPHSASTGSAAHLCSC